MLIIFLPKMGFAENESKTNEEKYILGDINNNKTINTSDLILILRHVYATVNNKHEEWILKDNEFIAADVTQNGKVDSSDIIVISRYIAAKNSPEIAKKHEDWLKIKEVNINDEKLIEVDSINLNKNNLELEEGATEKLVATIKPENATDKAITWSSSNSKIATVDKEGKVKGISKGEATITAKTSNGKIIQCKINVEKEELYDIILFWGQSNMVGSARETTEKRYNHNKYTYSGAKSAEEYSSLTGINKNILNNTGKTLDFVSIKQTKNTAYEYKYLTNTFEEIDSTQKMNYGENLVYKDGKLLDYDKTDKKYFSISKSRGTNMIPQFCQTYYNATGHKVIAVFAAHGGMPIQTFLPQNDSRNKKYNYFIYEAIKEKYNAAVKLAKNKKLKIGNKMYVVAQGETDVTLKTSKDTYKTIFKSVHNNLKKDLGIQKGAVVETSYTTGTKTMKEISSVHSAQEELIKENKDILLGSSYFYDRFVSKESDYSNCNTKVTKGTNSKKLSYKEALKRSIYSVDPTIIEKSTGKRNYIHFTSASLSQVGMEAAKSLAK